MTATALPLSSIYADGPSRPLAVERVVNPEWIYGDDKHIQYFIVGEELDGTANPATAKTEVAAQLDAEAMDDLIKYVFPSDLN